MRALNSYKLIIGSAIMILIVLTAILAHTLAPCDPFRTKPLERLQPPSLSHLFGTDELGRDLLSRVILGTRISLQVSLQSALVATLIGVLLGGLCFFRQLDNALMRCVDLIMAFPQLLVAILTIVVLGRDMFSLSLAIGISFSPSMARLIRSKILSIREQMFVEAARAVGRPELWILVRHVLPNSVSEIIVQTTITVGFAILIEAGLSYVGLGIPPPVPSWGRMISEAQGFLAIAPHLAIFPGIALLAMVVGVNMFGDGLRDVLDPRFTFHR